MRVSLAIVVPVQAAIKPVPGLAVAAPLTVSALDLLLDRPVQDVEYQEVELERLA